MSEYGFTETQQWSAYAEALVLNALWDEAEMLTTMAERVLDDLNKMVAAYYPNGDGKRAHGLDCTTLIGAHIAKLTAQLEEARAQLADERKHADALSEVIGYLNRGHDDLPIQAAHAERRNTEANASLDAEAIAARVAKGGRG